jgi:hypothetical protein
MIKLDKIPIHDQNELDPSEFSRDFFQLTLCKKSNPAYVETDQILGKNNLLIKSKQVGKLNKYSIQEKLKVSNDTFEFKSKTNSFAWLYHNYISSNKSKPKLYIKSKMTPFQLKEEKEKKLNEDIQKKLEKNKLSIDKLYVTNSSKTESKFNTSISNLKSFEDEKIESGKKKILNVKKHHSSSRVLTPMFESKSFSKRNCQPIQRGFSNSKELFFRTTYSNSTDNFNPSSCFKVMSMITSYIQK